MDELFDGISEKNRRKLLKMFDTFVLTFKKESIILTKEKEENILGIIMDGHAQIIKTDYNGNKSLIEDLYENDIFGTNISGLKNKEYDILTKEETKILILDYYNIIKHINSTNQFYNLFLINLINILTKRIEDRNQRIEILTKKTIRNKLLEFFSIYSKKSGSKYIYLPYNFTDLADFLAVDRSAMSRELKYLKEEGFIEIKGKRITLLYR